MAANISVSEADGTVKESDNDTDTEMCQEML